MAKSQLVSGNPLKSSLKALILKGVLPTVPFDKPYGGGGRRADFFVLNEFSCLVFLSIYGNILSLFQTSNFRRAPGLTRTQTIGEIIALPCTS